ncbi:hypothetical protein HK101_002802 [Irineochytrium annulatum]|nr:hypothetical protein HK101_002802 [Irineochytrium annulatum]
MDGPNARSSRCHKDLPATPTPTPTGKAAVLDTDKSLHWLKLRHMFSSKHAPASSPEPPLRKSISNVELVSGKIEMVHGGNIVKGSQPVRVDTPSAAFNNDGARTRCSSTAFPTPNATPDFELVHHKILTKSSRPLHTAHPGFDPVPAHSPPTTTTAWTGLPLPPTPPPQLRLDSNTPTSSEETVPASPSSTTTSSSREGSVHEVHHATSGTPVRKKRSSGWMGSKGRRTMGGLKKPAAPATAVVKPVDPTASSSASSFRSAASTSSDRSVTNASEHPIAAPPSHHAQPPAAQAYHPAPPPLTPHHPSSPPTTPSDSDAVARAWTNFYAASSAAALWADHADRSHRLAMAMTKARAANLPAGAVIEDADGRDVVDFAPPRNKWSHFPTPHGWVPVPVVPYGNRLEGWNGTGL